jgi:hypothetical protein
MSVQHTPGPIGLGHSQRKVGLWAESVFTLATPASIVAHLRRGVEELAALTHLGPAGARAAGGGEEEEAAGFQPPTLPMEALREALTLVRTSMPGEVAAARALITAARDAHG